MEIQDAMEVAHAHILPEGHDTNTNAPPLMLPASCEPPQPGAPQQRLVWIIFGATGHTGRSLVSSALAHGDLVCAVGRTYEMTPAAMSTAYDGPSSLGLLCDVRSRGSVVSAVTRARARFNDRIDVVVICSSCGVIGPCEDQDDHELRNQFETNFMGTLHVIQATLPFLREAGRGGRYLIFSATSGALGAPGLGPYCATKYAVEGLIEAMVYEVDPFDIKATLVEPGLTRRTDDDNDSLQQANIPGLGGETSHYQAQQASQQQYQSPTLSDPSPPLPKWGNFVIKPASAPYSHATSPALHAQRMVKWLGNRQPTSVERCAELVWQLAHCNYPPLRLVLGSYAIESLRDRLRCVTEELEDWKHLNHAVATDAEGEGEGGAEGSKSRQQEEKGGEGFAGKGKGKGLVAIHRKTMEDDDEDMTMAG